MQASLVKRRHRIKVKDNVIRTLNTGGDRYGCIARCGCGWISELVVCRYDDTDDSRKAQAACHEKAVELGRLHVSEMKGM